MAKKKKEKTLDDLQRDFDDIIYKHKNIASVCPALKVRYEKCFQKWYSEEFVKGTAEDIGCEAEFKEYQQCVVSHMKKKKLLKESRKVSSELLDDHLKDKENNSVNEEKEGKL